MDEDFSLTINGREETVRADGDMPLLYALRGPLGLTGTKYGCGVEQCGACAVLIDGERAFSCATPLREAAGHEITTIEGVGSAESLHPLQRAFIDEHAFQCGYCTAGLIVTAKALLDRNPDPDEAEIRTALRDNLCRCGTHPRVIAAIRRAAREMAR